MSFPLSPGVYTKEFDQTTVVPGVATSDAALVAHLKWGAVKEITLVSSETELVQKFGKPDNATAVGFFSAANFLSYSNRLHLVRVVDEDDALNATADGNGVLILNDDHYDQNFSGGQGNVGLWAARHPGELGNSLRVSMCPSAAAHGAVLTGTVDSAGNVLTGTGTQFLTQLEVGSIVVLPDGTEATVQSIASATSATLSVAPTPALDDATLSAKWEFSALIPVPPTTSDFAAARGGSDDELHVVVVDQAGKFTGQAGTILETFTFVSKAADAKSEDGTSSYYAEVINRTSSYIRWMDHPVGTNFGSLAEGTAFTAPDATITNRLGGGDDGSVPSDGDLMLGYDLFADSENSDISLIIGGNASSVVANYIIQNIAESRADCIALVSPPMAAVVNNPGQEVNDIINFRNLLTSSSYGVLDSGWKQQYDKYNDVFRWVPLNADTAGLCARTDHVRDAWYSPAGFNRGQVKSVHKLAFNPNKAARDLLFQRSVNCVFTSPGEGPVLLGDKTLLNKPSAFDAINVRRLFIVLKKSIARQAKYSLFEFNDAITRAQFRGPVEDFLAEVQGRRGITDFRVVCDSSNNTGDVIDRNEFVGDIYVKPARSIRYVKLNFIAVRTNVEFSEVIGEF